MPNVPDSTIDVESKIRHALIEYDRKELQKSIRNPRAYHNPNALGLYMQALHAMSEDLTKGRDVRDAIVGHFTGRLLDRCLVACGLPKSTDREQRGSLSDFGY
jgi:hypothetical protein